MAFTFTVKFNHNGELVEVEYIDRATNKPKKAFFPGDFDDVSKPLKKFDALGEDPISIQTIPIDLELLRMEGDDPCITHNGKRYCW